MASSINASTSGAGGLVSTADSSGVLSLQAGGATVANFTNVGGTAPRITGDFSNATITNRVAFQSSTANGNTILEFIPNGTSTQCNINLETDSAMTNGNVGSIYQNNGQMTIQTVPRGTGTATPMTFATNNVEQMRIAVDGTLSFNSGYGSAAVAYGCRAWVNFNGIGTVAIRASGNVSSITDNGVGIYTVNFTTAMPNANYGVSGVSSGGGSGGGTGLLSLYDNTAQTTSAVSINTSASNNGSSTDRAFVNVAIFR